jgi:hypothetical protein
MKVSSPFSQFKTNTDAETAGVWVSFGDYEIKLARSGGANKRFMQVLDDYMQPHKRAQEMGILDETTATGVLANVYADTIVLAWRTKIDDKWESVLIGPDGQKIEFNRDNVVKLLTEVTDFFVIIRAQAAAYQTFKHEMRVLDGKN